MKYKKGLMFKDTKISLVWSLARNRRTKALTFTEKVNGKIVNILRYLLSVSYRGDK